MRHPLPFGLRKGTHSVLDRDQALRKLLFPSAAQEVFDTDLVDPDAPEVEEPEAEQQDDDRSPRQRVGDQPAQHRFTAGRKM